MTNDYKTRELNSILSRYRYLQIGNLGDGICRNKIPISPYLRMDFAYLPMMPTNMDWQSSSKVKHPPQN